MKQQIVGFHQDEASDWVADLSCGHGFHMRHNPPWQIREWVLTTEGRDQFIGRTLDCLKCDRGEPPAFHPIVPASSHLGSEPIQLQADLASVPRESEPDKSDDQPKRQQEKGTFETL